MIRLGYPTCVSCHISPQGGGLLNLYGRSIDQAQSLVGGEYKPWQNSVAEFLNADGKITQDIRTVLQQQDVSTDGKPGTQIFRSRFLYRNATELGKGFRFTGTVMGENVAAPRSSFAYDGAGKPSQVFLTTALLSYRVKPSLEIAVGRDQLPTGVNISDLSSLIRSRNRGGYYDTPTQAKAFWWTKRYQLTPYVYAPGGNERAGQHESGGGVLAEVDVLGHQKTVVGVNLLRGTATTVDRMMVAPYARLGFGRWGILAEHDITERTLKTTNISFLQSATYGQLFVAAREWLVPSLVVERLRVERPYLERLDAMKLEVAARISSQFTVTVGPRLQRNEVTGQWSKNVVFQIAFKTVH